MNNTTKTAVCWTKLTCCVVVLSFAFPKTNMYVVHSNLHWLFIILCVFCLQLYPLFIIRSFSIFFPYFSIGTLMVINIQVYKKANCVEIISSEFGWRHDKSINFGSFFFVIVVVRFHFLSVPYICRWLLPFCLEKRYFSISISIVCACVREKR